MIQAPSSTPAAFEADSWTVQMTAAQRGDRIAYTRLLQEIRPRIRSIASRSLRDRRDVEDVIQDVLMTVHTVRATYDPTRPFSPWLTGIIKHRIADRIRVRGRIWAREDSFSDSDETSPALSVDPTESLEWSSRALKSAINGLPSGQRQAVTLLKLKEMSLQEASAASGMSVTALKVACHRALKALRVSLHLEVRTP
jgi:RNA polymerase sigma-70 factor, ECF subfamily